MSTLVLEAQVRPRLATGDELPAVCDTLAEAFFDDPVMSWCIRDPHRRRRVLPRLFDAIARAYLPHGEVYTVDRLISAAVWLPPAAELDEDALGATIGEVVGEDADRAFTLMELMGELHPAEPHHYLFLLGTRSQWQSKGIGSALMQPVLALCDRDRTPAYLEATSEGNRRLYLRHGFHDVGEVNVPDGPTLWRMWRDPA